VGLFDPGPEVLGITLYTLGDIPFPAGDPDSYYLTNILCQDHKKRDPLRSLPIYLLNRLQEVSDVPLDYFFNYVQAVMSDKSLIGSSSSLISSLSKGVELRTPGFK
jgi:hypothetical protein